MLLRWAKKNAITIIFVEPVNSNNDEEKLFNIDQQMISRPRREAYQSLFTDFGFDVLYDEIFTEGENDISTTAVFVLKAKSPIEYSVPTLANCINTCQKRNLELNLECKQKDAVIKSNVEAQRVTKLE